MLDKVSNLFKKFSQELNELKNNRVQVGVLCVFVGAFILGLMLPGVYNSVAHVSYNLYTYRMNVQKEQALREYYDGKQWESMQPNYELALEESSVSDYNAVLGVSTEDGETSAVDPSLTELKKID